MADYVSKFVSGSVDQFVFKLFRSLDEEVYPVNLIGTNTYHIFRAYAREFVSASVDLGVIYDNLSLDKVRSSAIYNNFGVYVDTNKMFYQDSYSYHSNTGLQGYRKGINFLWDAAMNGSTERAVHRIGHAYSGVGCLLEEHYDTPRWRLKTDSGSIISMAAHNIIMDSTKMWWPKNKWKYALLQITSGSTPYIPSGAVQDSYDSWAFMGWDDWQDSYDSKDAAPDQGYDIQDDYN